MITTFFGQYSFGGDAAYVDRLSRALLRQGHEVHVVACVDAFNIVRGNVRLRPYRPPPGLQIHFLKSKLGFLSPLWSHQTGHPGPKMTTLSKLYDSNSFDITHFHNVSLLGWPGLGLSPDHLPAAVTLMTAHDYWLVCPLHLLWQYNQRVCQSLECLPCLLHSGRPPQVWRYSKAHHHALRKLDALIFPSYCSLNMHRERGINLTSACHLPYFIPSDWTADSEPEELHRALAQNRAPYFIMAGRLIKAKGFHRIIHLMRFLPELNLAIAGTGPYESHLRQLAAGLTNVNFLGHLDYYDLSTVLKGARALIVPSLFPETFGYVVIESLAVGTPVIVRKLGALHELIEQSQGGLLFDSDEELLMALNSLAYDDTWRDKFSSQGRQAVESIWSEQEHLRHYFKIIETIVSKKNCNVFT
ncbi:glycosyltransferase family 4 protein [candidate division CSSED10-310 bacterium]|uniref:Glycosyltransferase family 4 protein n=1 Tax=candidate division CSSED10-310 bacterium TaxID=2855610 RepID=A0ABV6Z2J4_UNCC1